MTMYMCELSGKGPPHNSPVRKNRIGWFSMVMESELSRNQKRIAYDLVKTVFRFRLQLSCLHSAYDLVKTRLSESKAEAEGQTNHNAPSHTLLLV